MSDLSSIIGAMISSFLGPCKNHKLVIDDKEIHFVRCPQYLLEKACLMDHFNYLIENTIQYHHKQFGCSSTSLLAMWYFWSKEFQSIFMEGYDILDVIKHSQNILDDVINQLPQMGMNMEQSFFQIYNADEETTILRNSSCIEKLNKTFFKKNGTKPNHTPARVFYSSRHFSPFLVQSGLSSIVSLESIKLSEIFKRTISIIVRKLSHDDPEWSELISELWSQQISFSNDLKFFDEGIFICSLILPVSYTSVVEGLIIKSKLPVWYDQSIFLDTKSLIIKGSINFEYVHLGYHSAVDVKRKLNSNEIPFSEKDIWIKNCLALFIKLKVNLILVHGTVDSAISDFCSLHSILILSDIPSKEITTLCNATETSPCTYLLDCDYQNVILSLRVKEWNPDPSMKFKNDHQYVQITVVPSKEIVKLSTVILCHPNPVYLKCQEHQLRHFISRLKLATNMNKILPGGGKTEEQIYLKMKHFSFNNDLKVKVSTAIANGFKRYFDLVSMKLEMKENSTKVDAVDEMHSKIHAWLSAMSLIHLTVQCDSIVINELDNADLKESNCNLIGVL